MDLFKKQCTSVENTFSFNLNHILDHRLITFYIFVLRCDLHILKSTFYFIDLRVLTNAFSYISHLSQGIEEFTSAPKFPYAFLQSSPPTPATPLMYFLFQQVLLFQNIMKWNNVVCSPLIMVYVTKRNALGIHSCCQMNYQFIFLSKAIPCCEQFCRIFLLVFIFF